MTLLFQKFFLWLKVFFSIRQDQGQVYSGNEKLLFGHGATPFTLGLG